MCRCVCHGGPGGAVESGLGLDDRRDRRRDHRLEDRRVAPERLTIVAAMALVSYALRVVPQLLLTGWSFPASWDRYLRLLAYALVARSEEHTSELQSLAY